MTASLLSKFQGALVGAVVGDCIGARFENLWLPGIKVQKVLKFVDKVEEASKEEDDTKRRQWNFTDDTAMARSVAASLIDKKGFDAKDLAKRFSEEYSKEPFRGYGASIGNVFKQLSESNYLDIYGPARNQFEGQGSYGNGGGMRISPAALFLYNQREFSEFQDVVEKITRITHTHEHAVLGAILECSAVHQALHEGSNLDVNKFIDLLINKIRPLEKELEKANMADDSDSEPPAKKTAPQDSEKEEVPVLLEDLSCPYCAKLEKIRQYATQDEQPSTEEINEVLGTDISALRSVPTAVYAFLRSLKEVEEIQGRNPFERTIIYSISLGGDTDTIATMAGAIAGAYYGIESIPQSWQKCCEGVKDALEFANDLHSLQT